MKVLKHSILILLIIAMMFPVIFVIMGATNDSGWVFNLPFKLSFGTSFLKNYHSIYNDVFNIWQSLMISLLSSLLISIISIIILFFAAYSLSKFEFKHKNLIWSLFIALSLIPQPAYLLGQLDVINNLNMYSTFIGLVLPFVINLRVLIYLKEACSYIPDTLLKAGRMEGASEWRVMFQIAIPHVKDKIFMAIFLLFLASWNNFLVPMIITSDSKLFNLPTLISSIADPYRYDIGAIFMALLFSIIPMIIVFLLTSHYIYEEE